jgi:hypothetical protein
MLEIEEVKKKRPRQHNDGDGGKNKGFSFHPCALRFILGFKGLSFNGIIHLSALLSSCWDGLSRTGTAAIARSISESAGQGKTREIPQDPNNIIYDLYQT